MSLEKAIKHKKEKRKPYRDSKAWDSSCRNHGSCSWCESNRLHSEKKRKASSKDQLDRYYDYYDEQ
jgi:hypothetical protein